MLTTQEQRERKPSYSNLRHEMATETPHSSGGGGGSPSTPVFQDCSSVLPPMADGEAQARGQGRMGPGLAPQGA